MLRRVPNCILAAWVLLSCKPNNRDIISLLSSKQDFNAVTNIVYSAQSGFCSLSLFLNNDYTFLKESGCEGRSHITIGTWKIVKDSVELTALDNSKLTLIANVELSKENKSSMATFLFTDKTGFPTNDFVIFPINKNEKYRATSNPNIVLDANGSRIYCPKTDVNGYLN